MIIVSLERKHTPKPAVRNEELLCWEGELGKRRSGGIMESVLNKVREFLRR